VRQFASKNRMKQSNPPTPGIGQTASLFSPTISAAEFCPKAQFKVERGYLTLGARTPSSANACAARASPKKREPRLLFALRAQCGRGRPRSQYLASLSFLRVLARASVGGLRTLNAWRYIFNRDAQKSSEVLNQQNVVRNLTTRDGQLLTIT
jgi:hypothetical protein